MAVKQRIERIKELDYRTIGKGFYQVLGITDFGKICINGNVCGGILMQLIEQTKKDKGTITRVRSKEQMWDDETAELIKNLQADNKRMKTKLAAIKRVIK